MWKTHRDGGEASGRPLGGAGSRGSWAGSEKSIHLRRRGAPGSIEGHVADLERGLDHDGHGARHGDADIDLLFAGGYRHRLGHSIHPEYGSLSRQGMRDMTELKARDASMAKRWYIVHAYSNFERKVAEDIKKRAHAAGLGELFEDVLVPTEEVMEVRRGRKVQAERKFFPGYVLVKMQMTDAAFLLIKNTPKVTGFLGADNKAVPIT